MKNAPPTNDEARHPLTLQGRYSLALEAIKQPSRPHAIADAMRVLKALARKPAP